MGNNSRIKITAYTVTGAWSLVLFIAGVKLSGIGAKVLSLLPSVIVVLFAVFDNWLWNQPGVRKFVGRPDLRGTWMGTLTSMRPDINGEEVKHKPIPIFFVVRQTYLDMSITLLSAESKSRSIGEVLRKNQYNDFSVYYHYDNIPDLENRDRSPKHAGGARIEIAGLRPESLSGEYWTDRRTRGLFAAKRASKTLYGSYADAVRELIGRVD